MALRVFLFLSILCIAHGCAAPRTDGPLQNEIARRFNANDQLRNVTCIVSEGIATLSGSVTNDGDRTLAEALAKVDGIKSIINRITVAAPTPEPTPEIAADENAFDEPVPSLYDEAFVQAKRFVDEHTVNCGELYYLQSDDYLWVSKNPFNVEVDGKEFFPKELSEADKLNNVDPLPVQWRGTFKITIGLNRTMSLGLASYKTWSEWRDSDSHKAKPITKAKGTWTITNESNYVHGGKIKKLIPQYCRDGSRIDIPGAFK